MENYQINSKTLAIMPIGRKHSKIYENENVIIVDKPVSRIISENCEYNGSSYAGRKKGTMELIGVTHKAPIVVQEDKKLIFFPTCSPRMNDCGWISLNNIESYVPYENGESLITFSNNFMLQVNVSNKIINNQVLRATRLEAVIEKRKNAQKNTLPRKNV